MYTLVLASPIAAAPARPTAAAPVLMARDDAGTVWSHANPVELYRWIARRNDLLGTIAVASQRSPAAWEGLRAN